MTDNPKKSRKYTILALAMVILITAGAIAIDSGTMPFLMNNTSSAAANTSSAQTPLSVVISNLTNPAGSEALQEVPTRPPIEGTVSASETESSFAYQKNILSAFTAASSSFQGAGKAMTSYEMTTYSLVTHPDVATPGYLGRPYGAMTTVVINGTPGILENTLWGYETDATIITRAIMTGEAGADTGFVAVSFVPQDTDVPVFHAFLTAEDALALEAGGWESGTYICQDDWSHLRYDDTFISCGYEDPGERIIPATGKTRSYDEFDKYGLYVSPSDVRTRIEDDTVTLQGIVSEISAGALNYDFAAMAQASIRLMEEARSIKAEISALPAAPDHRDEIDEFIRGVESYRMAGARLWYGASFTEPDAIREGNEYLIAGIEHNNNALKSLNLQEINTEHLTMPSEDIYPRAMYIYDYYRYQDAKKINDISIKLTGVKEATLYITTNEDGNEEKILSGYGYKYVLPIIEVGHYGYRGGGTSRITTPDPSKFTIIWKGEKYTAESPSGYLKPLGHAYTRQYLERKEIVEALLLFRVPADLRCEEAYLTVDLGSEGTPVWHLVQRA